MGTFLDDGEIVDAMTTGAIVVDERIDLTDAYRPVAIPAVADLPLSKGVQPCSLDFRIGRIFHPPSQPWPDSGLPNEAEYAGGGFLEPGQTLIVETLERIKLPPNIGAIGFPPARMTRNAVLATNSGHIDPGYKGHLSFTLINMGRQRFNLKSDDTIVTLLLFRMDNPSTADYEARAAVAATPQLTPAARLVRALNRLSPDFAALSSRIEKAAQDAIDRRTNDFKQQISTAENKLSLAQLWMPALAAILVAGIAQCSNESVRSLETKLDSQQRQIGTIDNRIADLEKQGQPQRERSGQ